MANSRFFFFLIFSQVGSQYFSNYTVLLALDSPHTPRLWRPHLGSRNPEIYAFFKLYDLDCYDSRCPRCWEMQWSMPSPAESSPLPRSSEPIMPLHMSRSNSAFGRAGIRKTKSLVCNSSELKLQRHSLRPQPITPLQLSINDYYRLFYSRLDPQNYKALTQQSLFWALMRYEWVV